MSEFRRHLRKPVDVQFKADDSSGFGALYFDSADVSLGGAFLKSDLLLEEGEELVLELPFPDREPVKTTARVMWVRIFPKGEEPSGMGVQFLDLSPEDREALARLIG